MMLFVTGGSGSGKSAYAEQAVLSLSQGKDMKRYYLATMQATDPEGQEKIKRHRKLRMKKDFITIEQPTDIPNSLDQMHKGERIALLECISTLTANEMFSGGQQKPGEWVAEKIVRDVKALKEGVTHLVVVGSNVFEDGAAYDAGTMEYIRAMGRVHGSLAALADQVTEVVVGIPVPVKQQKGGKPCGF